ncbi:MAG: NADH-quinone oxidoreductase subunit J, partial [Dehalococcoidia bacterium]|nr:NADH-quinone oxidoreductase subunit J [Dehalococcoidia bacterium]
MNDVLTAADIFMLLVAVTGGAAAISVVISRNVVHAALFLVVTLLSVAGTFLMLGAEFLAWTQVLVYVGAVIVLILFGLMLTRAPIGPMAQHNENGHLAFGVSTLLFLFLCLVIFRAFGDVRLDLQYTGAAALGEVIYVEWAFPFMALGFMLTVALIGAIILARREEGEGPVTDLADEIPARDSRDVTASPGAISAGARAPGARAAGGGSAPGTRAA